MVHDSKGQCIQNTLARVIFLTFINDFKKNPLSISHFQLGQRLDDLLELLCTDIKADTVEEAESALRTLAEKVDTICEYIGTMILYTLFIEPTCAHARWALMRRLLSFRLSVCAS